MTDRTLSLGRPAGAAAHRQPASAAPPARSGERAAVPDAVRSEALLQGRSHISIMHNGEIYQLRATRLGKLILTK